MRKVVGIDPDVRRVAYGAWGYDPAAGGWRVTAVATLERTTARGARVEEYGMRLRRLVLRAKEEGAAVWCEDIYLAESRAVRNVQTFKGLAKVQGELEAAFADFRVPLSFVTANRWRQAVLGFTAGRADLKAAAIVKCGDDWGHPGLTEHEADALCIGWYGVEQELEREL